MNYMPESAGNLETSCMQGFLVSISPYHLSNMHFNDSIFLQEIAQAFCFNIDHIPEVHQVISGKDGAKDGGYSFHQNPLKFS